MRYKVNMYEDITPSYPHCYTNDIKYEWNKIPISLNCQCEKAGEEFSISSLPHDKVEFCSSCIDCLCNHQWMMQSGWLHLHKTRDLKSEENKLITVLRCALVCHPFTNCSPAQLNTHLTGVVIYVCNNKVQSSGDLYVKDELVSIQPARSQRCSIQYSCTSFLHFSTFV